MRRRHGWMFTLPLLTAMAALLLAGAPGYSYLPSLTTPGPQPDHWNFSAFPVQWNLNPNTSGAKIHGSRGVADVVQAGFNTWLAAPNAVLAVTRGPDSSASSESSSPPTVNLICFVCSDADFNKDGSTLAVTITTTADAAGQSDRHGGSASVGQLLKADIVFNPAVDFTTDGSCPVGITCQDLLTVATHEEGHFFGLDHSAVVRAVMYPAASSLVTLSYDDVAGISLLYPKNPPDLATGMITGTVTLVGGGGVFGAHVFAQSVTNNQPFGGTIRKTPIGTLTRPGGGYTIQGLPGDSYIVAAEPLDGPVSNTDVSGYPAAFGQPSVQTNFTARWH